MTIKKTGYKWAAPAFAWVVAFVLSVGAQRPTIPELAAKDPGGIRGRTAPSGSLPAVETVLETTDLIVRGTLGQPLSYLSNDQYDVLTDYPLLIPVVLYSKDQITTRVLGEKPQIVVTQLGGFEHQRLDIYARGAGLPALKPGMEGLFLLSRRGGKWRIAAEYFGAFEIADGRLRSMAGRRKYAADYEETPVADGVARMRAFLSTLRR